MSKIQDSQAGRVVFKKIKALFLRLLEKKEERFLEKIFALHLAHNPKVQRILAGEFDDAVKRLAQGRNLPSKERHKKNDWWKTMLLRYGLDWHFSGSKRVLDTCSGLDWGLYLMDEAVKSAAGVEIDSKAAAFSKRNWPVQHAHFINASVLEMPVKDRSHEVALAFESIEHFKLADIETYLQEIYRALKPGSLLIGSSYFPDTRQEAERICAQNKHHLYICCQDEFKALLHAVGFKKARIFRNRVFFTARK